MTNTEQAPEHEGKNPFQLLAFVFYKVRQSLEEEEPRRAPRWVRIVRAREAQGSGDIVGKAVKVVLEKMLLAFSYIAELVLDIQELLVQTDAAKALFEVSADLLKAVTSDEFVGMVSEIVGGEKSAENPLGAVNDAFEAIKKKAAFIPEPEDVRCVGHELFRLLCVVQEAHPLKDDLYSVDEDQLTAGTKTHVDIVSTGKLRLIQWAYGLPFDVQGLGAKDNAENERVSVSRFGARRLWEASADRFATKSVATREHDDDITDTIFDLSFAAEAQTTDIRELHALLGALGYGSKPADASAVAFDAKLRERLREFQFINELPVTGRLDNDTINRLLNLDLRGQNLCRAKPHDPERLPVTIVRAGELPLVNGDADHPEDEGAEILTSPIGYTYYIPGTKLGQARDAVRKRGWLYTDAGFVALRSRRLATSVSVANSDTTERYDGGVDSPGEASSGDYFFAARNAEPWRAGRNGPPADGSPALYSDAPARGDEVALYQWIDLTEVAKLRGQGQTLRVHASVNVRTIHKPEGEHLVSDQGRLVLEPFGASSGSHRGSKPQTAVETPWYPKDDEIRADREDHALRRRGKFMWKRLRATIDVPKDDVALALVLEAKHQTGWDTDVFFDTAQARWEIVEGDTSSEEAAPEPAPAPAPEPAPEPAPAPAPQAEGDADNG